MSCCLSGSACQYSIGPLISQRIPEDVPAEATSDLQVSYLSVCLYVASHLTAFGKTSAIIQSIEIA